MLLNTREMSAACGDTEAVPDHRRRDAQRNALPGWVPLHQSQERQVGRANAIDARLNAIFTQALAAKRWPPAGKPVHECNGERSGLRFDVASGSHLSPLVPYFALGLATGWPPHSRVAETG